MYADGITRQSTCNGRSYRGEERGRGSTTQSKKFRLGGWGTTMGPLPLNTPKGRMLAHLRRLEHDSVLAETSVSAVGSSSPHSPERR